MKRAVVAIIAIAAGVSTAHPQGAFYEASEAEIAGERPSYYLKYDETVPDDERVEQVVDWLKLPAEKRPHFITLYFSDVDSAGHSFGPDAPGGFGEITD